MDPSDVEGDDSARKKVSRGATQMKGLTLMANKGKRLVNYNSYNQPIDKNSEKLASYVGSKVRQHIPIDIKNWRSVPMTLKDNIWVDVKRTFTLEDERKHDLLKAAGKQWKGFKTYLTTEYIAKGLTANPPQIYNFIEQENWENFVNIRASEEFKALSEKNKDNQSKYKYKHRIGRMGYARLEQKLIAERSLESESTISSIDRAEMWCLARLKPDGTYTTDESKEVAKRIDSITQSASQGDIHPSGLNDVLTMAIGTSEHPGRVRAVGQAIPIGKYFHEPRQRRRTMTEEEMNRLLDVKLKAKAEEMMNEFMLKYQPRASPHHEDNDAVRTPCPPPKSGYDSCSVSKDILQIPEVILYIIFVIDFEPQNILLISCFFILSHGSFMCDLAIDHDHDKLVVARGIVYNIGGDAPFLHNQPLGVDNVKVSITKPIIEGALLPFPTNDIKFVGDDAIGTFLKWPKKLVILDTKTMNKEKDVAQPLARENLHSKGSLSVNLSKHKVEKESTSNSLKAVYIIAKLMKDGMIFPIPMHEVIFGYEHDIPLDRYEILQFVGKKEIGAACISIYMKYLFMLCGEMDVGHMYGFICSYRIAHMAMATRTERVNYIVETMKECELGCLYFAPYNVGGHWILCVIDPHKTTVYWLDPLLEHVRDDIENVINSAVAIFISARGIKNVRDTNIKTTWKRIQCLHQPDAAVCGYYVMQYMREIITSKMKTILIKFNSKLVYTDEEVDGVREEWACFLVEQV